MHYVTGIKLLKLNVKFIFKIIKFYVFPEDFLNDDLSITIFRILEFDADISFPELLIF